MFNASLNWWKSFVFNVHNYLKAFSLFFISVDVFHFTKKVSKNNRNCETNNWWILKNNKKKDLLSQFFKKTFLQKDTTGIFLIDLCVTTSLFIQISLLWKCFVTNMRSIYLCIKMLIQVVFLCKSFVSRFTNMSFFTCMCP